MKIIDKRNESKKDTKDKLAKAREVFFKVHEEVTETPKLKIVLDWRLAGVYNEYMSDKVIFEHERKEARTKYFKQSIEEREDLNNLIVDSYIKPKENGFNVVELECTQEQIDLLEKEARKLRLNLDEYLRGLFHTKGYNYIEDRKQRTIYHKDGMKLKELISISGGITQELKSKLEEDYGIPERKPQWAGNDYPHTDMLIDLAEQHYGIK